MPPLFGERGQAPLPDLFSSSGFNSSGFILLSSILPDYSILPELSYYSRTSREMTLAKTTVTLSDPPDASARSTRA